MECSSPRLGNLSPRSGPGAATRHRVVRRPHDTHLLILGILSVAAACIGRAARRKLWVHWARIHISGMGLSYIILLTAFYVDNGPHLPVWKHLPDWTYWLAPSLVGLPILLWALLRHPLVRRTTHILPW